MTSALSSDNSPVRLTGELDPKLSRWLWLGKMFLAIPHYLVTNFLLGTGVYVVSLAAISDETPTSL